MIDIELLEGENTLKVGANLDIIKLDKSFNDLGVENDITKLIIGANKIVDVSQLVRSGLTQLSVGPNEIKDMAPLFKIQSLLKLTLVNCFHEKIRFTKLDFSSNLEILLLREISSTAIKLLFSSKKKVFSKLRVLNIKNCDISDL